MYNLQIYLIKKNMNYEAWKINNRKNFPFITLIHKLLYNYYIIII